MIIYRVFTVLLLMLITLNTYLFLDTNYLPHLQTLWEKGSYGRLLISFIVSLVFIKYSYRLYNSMYNLEKFNSLFIIFFILAVIAYIFAPLLSQGVILEPTESIIHDLLLINFGAWIILYNVELEKERKKVE